MKGPAPRKPQLEAHEWLTGDGSSRRGSDCLVGSGSLSGVTRCSRISRDGYSNYVNILKATNYMLKGQIFLVWELISQFFKRESQKIDK